MALNPNIPLSVQPAQIQSPMQGAQQMLTLRELMVGAQARGAQRDAYRQQQMLAEQQAQAKAAFLQEWQQSGGKMTRRLVALGTAANISPADLQSFAGVDDWGRPKIESWQEVAGEGGAPAAQGFDAYGRPVGEARPKAVKPDVINTGGRQVGIRPYSGETVFEIENTLSPEAILTDQRTRAEGAANRGVTIRGQNLAEARAVAEAEWRRNNPTRQWMETTDGVVGIDTRGILPPLQGMGPDGRPLPGKPLTESQANSVNYANRMLESHKTLTDLEDVLDGWDITQLAAKQGMGGTWVIGGALEAAGNKILLGENEQKYEQAQRDFVNAVLRKESGAVISDEEFANAKKQYFPQPGDTAQVIEQKRQNRARAIVGISAGTGPRQEALLRELEKSEFERRQKASKASGRQAEGNVAQRPAVGQTFADMPDPAQHPGVTIRDKQNGITYRSDGQQWRAVR